MIKIDLLLEKIITRKKQIYYDKNRFISRGILLEQTLTYYDENRLIPRNKL